MKVGDRVSYQHSDGPRRATIVKIDPWRWHNAPGYRVESDAAHRGERVYFWLMQFELEPLSAVELLGEVVRSG